MNEAPLRAGSVAFPVPLVCPQCGRTATTTQVCATTNRPCVSLYRDIPRFLFGQRYWGETGSDTMGQLLEEARNSHWRKALEQRARNQAVTRHLLSPIRADFLHVMPWDRIRTVLDVGAGMGFMSCDMAAYADRVISLEAVPERAEFIQIRANQDRLKVSPVIASALAMPFPPESFDLITLNGVFEYLGLWGEGDPKTVQERFLTNALRLLRPGGYLYVGIETRYAKTAFLGVRDHSGLAYTSLMPRRLADLYSRIRSKPFYGSEHTVRGYRTYTYTPLQYAHMFRRAGFADVYLQGVFEGYNRQVALYDINDYPGRQRALSRTDPPASMLGSLRRLVTENRATYRTLENEVVIFARKTLPGASAPATPWSDIVRPNQTVVQLNQNFRTLAIVSEGGVPVELLEMEKKGQEAARRRGERSFDILQRLQERYKDELRSFPVRWPAPRGILSASGRVFRRYEYIHGRTLSSLLLPRYYHANYVPQLIRRALSGYALLCDRLSACVGNSEGESNWATIRSQLTGIEVGDDIRRDLGLAVDAGIQARWQLSAIHGDFTPGNLLVTPSDDLVLIDWEHVTAAYPIGADLIRFLQDATQESARLRPRPRRNLLSQLHQSVTAVLETCGYSSKDYRYLEALYIAQQIAALGGEDRVYPALIEAYRRGPLLEQQSQ